MSVRPIESISMFSFLREGLKPLDNSDYYSSGVKTLRNQGDKSFRKQLRRILLSHSAQLLI